MRERIDRRQLWVSLTMALAEANPGTHPESTGNVRAAKIILEHMQCRGFKVFADGRDVDIGETLKEWSPQDI